MSMKQRNMRKTETMKVQIKPSEVQKMTHEELINEFELGYEKLLNKVHELKDERLYSYKLKEEDWSIKEIIVHIADVEMHGYLRIRTVISEPGQKVMRFDQEKWARELNYQTHSVSQSLEIVKVCRATNAKLLRIVPKDKWNNVVNHSEWGEMDLYGVVEYFTNHLLHHLYKIDQRIDQYLASKKM